jgi:1-acyl-sn-glycerol-3-phosphate acyltransferase
VKKNSKIKNEKLKLAESPHSGDDFHSFTFCTFFNFLEAKWFWFVRWMCRVFCMLFFRMRSYGRENIPGEGPFVLISNHQSYLDPMLCGGPIQRRVSFLARESLFNHWLFGRMIY